MTTVSRVLDNFPFPTLRDNQEFVLREIDSALKSYRYVILEAPTGTGKSPIAIASALSQGSSYITTSTKNLQTQYHNDFRWVLTAKGRPNFTCPILKDKDAPYTTADHAPCLDSDYRCDLKTRLKDYYKKNAGTKDESVYFDEASHAERYPDYSDGTMCAYYHQRNKALTASHSVLNYSMLLSLLRLFPMRNLLVLDEVHELPQEVIKFQQFSISKIRWKKYLGADFTIPKLDIDDLRGWIDFLIGLKENVLKRLKIDNDLISDIAETERKILHIRFESQVDKLMDVLKSLNQRIQSSHRFIELSIEVREDISRLDKAISEITSEPHNWIVSELKFDDVAKDVAKVVFKPLDVSKKCQKLFEKGKQVLMMSATILDSDTFCRDVGLDQNDVKVIRVGSNFPVVNRPVYSLDIAYLNKDTLRHEEVKQAIVKTIDKIMTRHKDCKGIVHLTSYDQLNYIMLNISKENKQRLLKTDPDIPGERDQVIEKHFNTTEPTVLISPSLHLGLDLKDSLSRFQIIVKVPYANLGDRWINARYNRPGGKRWYSWLSALHLVQAVGRSVRSETDWAYTYVLDSGLRRFVDMNREILPNWFLETIKW